MNGSDEQKTRTVVLSGSIRDQIEQSVASLKDLWSELVRRRDQAAATATTLDELLLQLDNAITCLQEPPIKKRVSKSKASKKPKDGGYSNKAEIFEIVMEKLGTHEAVAIGEIEKHVRETLKGRERNLSISAKLLKDCLNEGNIVQVETDKYALSRVPTNGSKSIQNS